jgi:hypothetical protein
MLRDRRLLFLLVMALIVAGAWLAVVRDRANNLSQFDTESPSGYSADFVEQNIQHPEKSSTGTIRANLVGISSGLYRQTIYPDHEEVSLWLPQAGINRVFDPQSKTYWTPKTQSAISLTISDPDQPPDPFQPEKNSSRKFIGRETLNGRIADHWQITEPSPTGTPYLWQYWQDARLRTTLKYDKPGIGTYQLKAILEGPQSDRWFIFPEGYREVPAP